MKRSLNSIFLKILLVITVLVTGVLILSSIANASMINSEITGEKVALNQSNSTVTGYLGNSNTIYSVNIEYTTGGSISTNSTYEVAGTSYYLTTATVAGATINLTITPVSGMQLKAGTLKYNDGIKDYLINGTSFIMPAADITVTAQFEQIPGFISPESDFEFSNGTIETYIGPGGNVVIPATIGGVNVTSIQCFAFSWYDSNNKYGIISVTIPNGVTSIGAKAFELCCGLTSITIPSGLTSIGDHAFDECEALKSITIPDTVTSIGDYAFRYCSNLTSVAIPSNVKSINEGTFYSCSSLKSLTIPECVTTIGDYSFEGCSNLTNVTIPQNVTSIGQAAFSGTSLISISLPNSVNSIGRCAFDACSDLSSITIPNNVTTIRDSTFCECTSLISVTIPNNVTSIEDFAFDGCSGLNNVTISNSMTSIGNFAFYYCNSLGYVYFEGNAPTMGGRVFDFAKSGFVIYYNAGATGFTDSWNGYQTAIYQPVTATTQEKSNLKMLSGKSEQLTATVSPDNASDRTVTWSIVCSSAANVATVDQNGLVAANSPGTVIIRATSKADSTKYADCSVTIVAANTTFSVNIGNIIPGGSITTTSTSTVAGTNISLTITPFTGMQLKAGTLKYNDGSKDYPINGSSFIMPLSNITVSGQFEQIPGYTASSESDFIFSEGTILGYKGSGGNVIIPATIGGMNVYNIGDSAFNQCTKLTNVIIPNDVKVIGGCAFSFCSGLRSISIPNSVNSIGDSAFYGCNSLTDVTIPNSVDSIGNRLFYVCSNLKSITLS